MSSLKRCLMHNKIEYCVRIGMGFSKAIHPELDWMCLDGLAEIESWKHPNPSSQDEREYCIEYKVDKNKLV